MNQNPFFQSSRVSSILVRQAWLAALPALLAGLGTGCYRASGVQRPTVVSQEISTIGGDRVQGLKAEGAPGDYYLGNDYLEMVVDGTPFGESGAVALARSGGSIIDVGKVDLDHNYKRVSTPTDGLERLTPVINQDPELCVVFDAYRPGQGDGGVHLEMEGRIYDINGKLGAPLDSEGCVQGVQVIHTVSLGEQDRYFVLSTRIVNLTDRNLPIQNIGDFLYQQSGVLRFNVPAREDMQGKALTTWGVNIPGTTFGELASAVKSPMVAFMGVEPVGTREDIHTSYGLLPVDGQDLVVNSDAQTLDALSPVFPNRLVAGCLPVAALNSGGTLSYSRRLYMESGASGQDNYPSQATGLFNRMMTERLSRLGEDSGFLVFQPMGSATRQGAMPVEFRIERKIGGAWKLERTEWAEGISTIPGARYAGDSWPERSQAPQFTLQLPVGEYRLVARNGEGGERAWTELHNANSSKSPSLPTPIRIEKFSASLQNAFNSNPSRDYICPERDQVLTAQGNYLGSLFTTHRFVTRFLEGGENALQPFRVVLVGQDGTVQPSFKRLRTLGSQFNPTYRKPIATDSGFGVYGFQAGNSLFGTSSPMRKPLGAQLKKGSYLAMAIRGPLSSLEQKGLEAFDGQSDSTHTFTFQASPLPKGWTTFDVSGPSLASTGGTLHMERLSSALAEGVQVLAMREEDKHIDVTGLTKDFKEEFLGLTETDLKEVAQDPFTLTARSSRLGEYGEATSLFVPEANNDRMGGARASNTWTLADFITQCGSRPEDRFTVIHRPRGPQGLFTQMAFDPKVALGEGVNVWWNTEGTLSMGARQGSFDAIELLRGEGCGTDAWWKETQELHADWMALLKQQKTGAFTKALGLSSATHSVNTPIGLARTYVKAEGLAQDNMDNLLAALQKGAIVASTGPLLDVKLISGDKVAGPGDLLVPGAPVTLEVSLWAPDWVPVEELRVYINGVETVLDLSVLKSLDPKDPAYDRRLRKGTFQLNIATDAFVVVEAGAKWASTMPYAEGTPWHALMKGIVPMAIANPIFVDVDGKGYQVPGL